MLTNVRAALRMTTMAWHDVHRESERNRHVWREASDSFKKKLRDALHQVFNNTDTSALFRETIRSRYPETLPMLQQYQKERNESTVWLSRHPLPSLEKKLQRALQDRDVLQENSRRSSPALHNHMYQIGDLLKEAAKEGLVEPTKTYEQDPESWMQHLSAIERALEKDEVKTSFLQRLLGAGSSMHAAKRAIEKSTREGFPTIMLHVRESLDLQRKLMDQYNKAVRDVTLNEENIKKHDYYTQRLQELNTLGETGFLLAHTKDEKHIQAMVDSLDADCGGPTLARLLQTRHAHNARQGGLEMASAMLSGWNEWLQNAESILTKREADVVEYSDDPIGDMCALARKGAGIVQRWLASETAIFVEDPFETRQMIAILRDIDTRMMTSNQRFVAHPVRRGGE